MEVVETEILELDSGRYIQLEKYRQWPKLGVLWSVRRRVGESDYPLQRGAEEDIAAGAQDPDDVWNNLRDSALAAARLAAETDVAASAGSKRPSLFTRLFSRG